MPHKVKITLVNIVLLLAAGTLPAQTHTTLESSTAKLVVPTPNGIAADVLISIATANHIPLGIVSQSRSLCETSIRSSLKGDVVISDVVSELNKEVPSYHFAWESNTLIARPRMLSASTENLLAYRLREFKTNSKDTHLGMVESLWIFIRGQLYPDQGTGFVGGSPANEEMLSGFTVYDQTVEQILDQIVHLGSGGAWLIKASPNDWRTSRRMPFRAFGYIGDSDTLAHTICSDDAADQASQP